MKDSIVLSKNPNLVSRVIDKERILLPIYKTSREINCIYSLNPVASSVWEMIDGKRNISQIKKKISQEFEATGKEIEDELGSFLRELVGIKAVGIKGEK